MTPTSATTIAPRPAALGWTLVAAALGLLMASGDSLWIDELATMTVAEQPTLGAAVQAIVGSDQSEAQMPGYLLYAWTWEKMGGRSEWALRLSNVPWLALAAWALARSGAALHARFLPALLLVQPFLWTYVDELRPYCMQIAGGALLVWGATLFVVNLGRGVEWAVTIVAGAGITCSASMLGAVATLFFYVALAGMGWRRRWSIAPCAVAVLVAGNAALCALGAFYAWTLAQGAGGAKLWDVGLANVALVVYEFLGFFGLGPGRDAVREAARGGTSALARLYAPFLWSLGALAACYAGLFVTQARAVWRERGTAMRTVAGLALAVLAGAVFGLLGLAVLAKWPFWGRHLAPVFACWVVLLGWFVRHAKASAWGRIVTTCLCAALATSCLSLRFGAAHRHDNYRGAVALLEQSLDRGDRVWWAARDLADSQLYGAAFRSSAGEEQITCLQGDNAKIIAEIGSPDVVFLSKQDIFDSDDAVTAFLTDNQYELDATLKAFQIWRAPQVAPLYR